MARVTIEDSLKKIESRFTLVHITAQRARQISRGSKARVKSENRAVVTALREIADGAVSIEPSKEEEEKAEE